MSFKIVWCLNVTKSSRLLLETIIWKSYLTTLIILVENCGFANICRDKIARDKIARDKIVRELVKSLV